MGTSNREGMVGKNQNPGVGSYTTNFFDKPTTPAIQLGTDVRKPLNHDGKTPGPGTY